MGLTRRDPDEEFEAWLIASCESQGVPLAVTDAEAIAKIQTLLKLAG